MNCIFSIIAGLIQGLAEFLPISSSGHLVLLHELFGFSLNDDLAFDVVLHLGTLVALIVFFFPKLLAYFLAWLQSFVKPDLKNNFQQRIGWYLFTATIPAAVAGFLFEEQIDAYFREPLLVALTMIVVGLLLYWVDQKAVLSKDLSQLTFKNSFVIGLAQILSLIPGVSRSGITIIAGLSQKLNRQSAAEFSFLLSTPIVFGAGLKKVFDMLTAGAVTEDFGILLVGFLTSAVSGYLCIKFFLEYLKKHDLRIFVYYRILIGLAVIIYLLLGNA